MPCQYLPGAVAAIPVLFSYDSFSKKSYSGLRMMSDQVCDGDVVTVEYRQGHSGAGQICNAYNHRLGGD